MFSLCCRQALQRFIAAERRFPNRVGEIYMLRASPSSSGSGHRWTYFPRMTRDGVQGV
jgi:hypothetical protein